VTLAKLQAEAIDKTACVSERSRQPTAHDLAKDREGHFLAVNKAFADACGQPSPTSWSV